MENNHINVKNKLVFGGVLIGFI